MQQPEVARASVARDERAAAVARVVDAVDLGVGDVVHGGRRDVARRERDRRPHVRRARSPSSPSRKGRAEQHEHPDHRGDAVAEHPRVQERSRSLRRDHLQRPDRGQHEHVAPPRARGRARGSRARARRRRRAARRRRRAAPARALERSVIEASEIGAGERNRDEQRDARREDVAHVLERRRRPRRAGGRRSRTRSPRRRARSRRPESSRGLLLSPRQRAPAVCRQIR